ncbi:hypothetical protein PGTUg99_023381 [Puccinia graminis f. sp. tritici]|uniref:Uncharacterized protein n=1 Tax=Puccinia graminis f. sp. tritici TaxID=56615 RepID=A0A5B0QKM0_PUCGR|nr:hypothetical protein PGTUg99_023381 [Puccinia graminis f. sp. tritici]
MGFFPFPLFRLRLSPTDDHSFSLAGVLLFVLRCLNPTTTTKKKTPSSRFPVAGSPAISHRPANRLCVSAIPIIAYNINKSSPKFIKTSKPSRHSPGWPSWIRSSTA